MDCDGLLQNLQRHTLPHHVEGHAQSAITLQIPAVDAALYEACNAKFQSKDKKADVHWPGICVAAVVNSAPSQVV